MQAELMARLKALSGKYRYVLILLAAGLVLLLLPSGSKREAAAPAEVPSAAETCEERLSALLSRAEGVGKAQVMLTLEREEVRTYARETERESRQDADGSQQSESSTLAMEKSGSDTLPVTERVDAPTFRGAVVACEGADRAEIRLYVTEAVMAVTGLSSDRICVLKLG